MGDRPIALAARDVWAGYDATPALEAVSFELPAGSLAGLAGPNGSGKSTLLKTVLGLIKPWRGRIELFGEALNGQRARLGYGPQAEMVDWDFPATVRDVVMMGRYGRVGLLRRPGRADREAVAHALGQVEMESLADRQIGELSGGQQRRMLIARALAQEADLLLLDEPMAGLDPTTEHEMLSLFERLRDSGKTLLVATHDLSCIAACFDYTLLINRRLVAFGATADVLNTENLSAAFAEHLLLLPTEGGVYVGHHGHG